MSYTEAQNPDEVEELANIKYFDYGIGFHHNMPCCIYPDNQPAVLDCSNGIFTPSWCAQQEGWALVRYNTNAGWLTKFIFRLVRNRMFKYIDQGK
jgi:hypothetical protein